MVHFRIANSDDIDATTYQWDFGDGSKLETKVPATSHWFNLDLTKEESSYHVQVTAITPKGKSVGKRSVVIHSMYGYNRARGRLQLPTNVWGETAPDGKLTFFATNPENEAVTITREEVRWLPCAGGEPTLARSSALNLTVPADRGQMHTVNLPAIPTTACGVAVRMTGRGASSSLPVDFSVYDEVRRRPGRYRTLVDSEIKMLLQDAEQAGLINEDTRSVSMDDLQRWVREKRIDGRPNITIAWDPVKTGSVLVGTNPIKLPINPGVITKGGGDAETDTRKKCDPDDSSAKPPQPGFTCQPGELDDDWEQEDTYILNALKGDIVLSSQCGTIGPMLRALEPRQIFTHTGIMTRNHDHIRHSTSLKNWYEDNEEGVFDYPTDGFKEWPMRYGFPGTITSTVAEAFGEKTKRVTLDRPLFGNPANPARTYSYKVQGFQDDVMLCPGDEALVFPTIVNAASGGNRDELVKIADAALQIDGHYRFYGYTNGAIARDPNYTQTKEWPESPTNTLNKQATVCSTFIWSAAKKAGVTLEGALEAGEWKYPADAQTQDGLYFYPESARKAGANALFSTLYNEALKKSGHFFRALTDVPEDVSNQMVNCFASDFCSEDAKDSDRWKNPGVGRTVSPDNIMLWDIYGHNEPLAMRKGKYRRKFFWAPAEGSGSLDVTVKLSDGTLVPNARVSFQGGFVGKTNSQGKVSFTPVPGGSQEIHASIWFDGKNAKESCSPGDCELLAKNSIAVIRADRTTSLAITLPAPKGIRLVSINGTMKVVDFDKLRDEDDDQPINKTFKLNRSSESARRGTYNKVMCVDGEVRGKTTVNVYLNDDLSVKASITVDMWEGWGRELSDCKHGNDHHTSAKDTTVTVGDSNEIEVQYKNGDGRVTFDGEVSNLRAP
jgi:hypothetical protein